MFLDQHRSPHSVTHTLRARGWQTAVGNRLRMGNLEERMKSPRRELSTGHITGVAPLLQELRWFSESFPCCNARLILRNSAERLQDVFLAVSTPLAGA